MVFLESTDHHLSFHNSKSCCDSFAKLKIFKVTLQHIIASIYHNKTSIQAPKCIEMHHSKNWKWLSKQSSSLIVNISACEIAPIGSPRSLKSSGYLPSNDTKGSGPGSGGFLCSSIYERTPLKMELFSKWQRAQQASRLSTAISLPTNRKAMNQNTNHFKMM